MWSKGRAASEKGDTCLPACGFHFSQTARKIESPLFAVPAFVEGLEPRLLMSGAWPMPALNPAGSRVLNEASGTDTSGAARVSVWDSGLGYTSALTGDVNGDGLNEAVLRSDYGIDIFDENGRLQSSIPALGCRLDMLADLDGNGTLEIFVSDNLGDGILRIRAMNDVGDLVMDFYAVAPSGTGTMIAQSMVDLNGDGQWALAAVGNDAASGFRGIAVFDAQTGEEVYSSGTGPMVQSVRVADINGDGLDEIVHGGWGTALGISGDDDSRDDSSYIWGLDGAGAELWRQGPLNSGGLYDSAVIPADLDQDETMDLVFTAGSHGASDWTGTVGWIGRIDPATGEIVPGSVRDFGGPVEVQAVADLQPGGHQEVLVVHEDRSTGTFYLRELSGADGFADVAAFDSGGRRPTVQAINDLDGDGQYEVLVSAGSVLYGLGSDLSVEWEWSRPDDAAQAIAAAIVTDVTGDGINDVIVTSGRSSEASRVDVLTVPPPPDEYEYDDQAAYAGAIAVDGAAQTHSLHTGADEDWVAFTLTQAADVTIETYGVAGGDTEIELYGPNSTSRLIDWNDDYGESGYYSYLSMSGADALSAGVYYVRVFSAVGEAISEYAVSVGASPVDVLPDANEPNDTPVEATALNAGGWQIGSLPQGDEDWFTFDLPASSTVLINVGGSLGGDTEMWLKDGAGDTTIAYSDDEGPGYYSQIIQYLPAGTYTIRLTAWNDVSIYAITLVSSDGALWADPYESDDTPAEAKTIQPGVPQAHSFLTGSDEDWMAFHLDASAAVSLETSGLFDGSTSLWLYGPDSSSEPVDSYTDGGYAGLYTGVLEPGTYYVQVASGDGQSLSQYQVLLTLADGFESDDMPGEAGAIGTDGAAQTHALTPGDEDWVTFTLGGLSNVTIRTTGFDGDTVAWLYGPDDAGELVAWNDDSGDGLFSTIQAQGLPAGQYWVKVAAYSGDEAVASYDLTVDAGPVDLGANTVQLVGFADGSVTATFARGIAVAGADAGLGVYVVDDATGARIRGSVQWYRNNTVMVWRPTQAPQGPHTWSIRLADGTSGGFLDVYGLGLNPVGATLTWGLTGQDITPPRVLSMTGLPDGTAVVRFSEPMNVEVTIRNSAALRVSDALGDLLGGSAQWSDSGRTLTWQPTVPPSQADAWCITLSGGDLDEFADRSGNRLDGDGNGQAGGDFVASWQVWSPPHVKAFKGDTNGTAVLDFDQTMDAAAAQNTNVVVLDGDGRIVPGAFRWENQDRRLVWQPNQAPTDTSDWTIVLASSESSGLQGLGGLRLDGDRDDLAGGEYSVGWSVCPPSAGPLRIRDFSFSADGTVVITFNHRVLISRITAEDVRVTRPLPGGGSEPVPGAIAWSDGGLVLTWTPEAPPTASETWSMTLAGQNLYDFVDYAYNGLDQDANGTPGDVTRSFDVAAPGDPANPPYQDDWESNDRLADAKPVDLTAGSRTVSGLTIDHAGDEDWFSFVLTQTGTAKDQAFLRTAIGGSGQFGLDLTLYEADGTQLATTAGSPDTAQEAITLNGRAAGTYFVMVTGNVNPSYSLTLQTSPPTAETWTVLYYLSGDNDLDEAYYDELDRMERLDLPSNVSVAVQYDRLPGIRVEWRGDITDDWSATRRGILARDAQAGQLGNWLSTANPAQPELDMGSAQTLSDFLVWAVGAKPAQHYVLNLVDHGDAVRGLSWDQTSGQTFLDLSKIRQALDAAHTFTGATFDIILADTCLSDMAEMATVLAPFGQYMVASEELSYTGFLNKELRRFESNLGAPASEIATDLARIAVQSNQGAKSLQGRTLPATQAVVDLSKIADLNAAIQDFVDVAEASADGSVWAQIVLEARSTIHFYNPTSRDLGKFMQRLVAQAAFPRDIRDAAQAVQSALEAAVVANFCDADSTEGLAVTLPLVLSIPYANLAPDFVADTGWDRFLDAVSTAASDLTFAGDWAEPNDLRTEAYNLQPIQGLVNLTGLTLSSGSDVDYFRLQLLEGGDADSFLQGDSTVTLELYNSAWVKLTPAAYGAYGLSLEGLPAGTYQLRVTARNPGASGLYALSIQAPLSAEDWAGDNRTRETAAFLGLTPQAINPYFGLSVQSGQEDWFYVSLTNLTNGGGGHVELKCDDPAVTMQAFADGSDTPLTVTNGWFDIPAGTTGNLYFRVSATEGQPVAYSLYTKGPAYDSSGDPVLLQQWDAPGGLAHVAVFGDPSLVGADFSGVKVVFAKGDVIRSITLSSLPAGSVGFAVWGSTSVAKFADTRKVPTDLSFLAFGVPVTAVQVKSGLVGRALNGLTLGGWALGGNLDGDADASDLTALYLAAGSGAMVKIGGDVTGDLIASAGLKALTVGGRTSGGNVTLGGGGAVKAKFGRVLNESIDSAVALTSLAAAEWLHTGGGADHVSAPNAGSVTVTGNLQTGLVLSGDGVAAGKPALASLKVGGSLGGTWIVTGDVAKLTAGSTAATLDATVDGTIGSMTVGSMSGSLIAGHIKSLSVTQSVTDATLTVNAAGAAAMGLAKMTVKWWVNNSTIRSGGVLGSLTVGGLKDSTLVAGSEAFSNDDRPAEGDVAGLDLGGTLGSLTVKGVSGTAYAMKNSVVAACGIASLKLLNADPTPGAPRNTVLADSIDLFHYSNASIKTTLKPMAAGDWSADSLDVTVA